jgi:hypothetical protein
MIDQHFCKENDLSKIGRLPLITLCTKVKTFLIILECVVLMVIGVTIVGNAYSEIILQTDDFSIAAEQGFGDRHNSATWSMVWWQDNLYVGVARAYACFEAAIYHRYFPKLFNYPPNDPDMECTAAPQDLPLQAEIWRWSPEEDGSWQRVYQSPNNLEIPGYPGKFVSPDIGFRGATIHQEPDGTEALYFSGFSSRDFNGLDLPPPRILRTEDGLNFEAIPQDPGTFMGDLDESVNVIGHDHIMGFRSITSFNNRLYVVAGGAYGDGTLLESDNPAAGNDSFRQVTPSDMTVYSIIEFNGQLYVGSGARPYPIDPTVPGFTVYRTTATGEPPYEFIPVMTDGGHFRRPSKTVVHMEVFNNSLYIGTNQPAEVYRIHPDDQWDLIVGDPRTTPDGVRKDPLSGFKKGFDWRFGNIHIHRMKSHDGAIYIGTNDNSTSYRKIKIFDKLFSWQYGFDFYGAEEPWSFKKITTTGFDDMFNRSCRNLASTPFGLFVGSQNSYYGLQIWRGIEDTTTVDLSPLNLDSEVTSSGTILSWEYPSADKETSFHIFRADYIEAEGVLQSKRPEFRDVGQTDKLTFVDPIKPDAKRFFHYYIVAESPSGTWSPSSNLIRSPSMAPPITFGSLVEYMQRWADTSHAGAKKESLRLQAKIKKANSLLNKGSYDHALKILSDLRLTIKENKNQIFPDYRVDDLSIMITKISKRLTLVSSNILSKSSIE